MPDDLLIGQQLDEYRLEALLGQGGMARVYRGLDVRLKRWVAIKVIDSPFRADSDYIMRFEREAQAIAQLEHPHIVRLYRYGEVKDLLYMAMQYVEGAPLDQVLSTYRDDGAFIEPEEASQIVCQICLALDYAHSKGVIHRDIKPSNIMLTKQGNAILADFGLALLTEVGTRGEIFGTPHYMAPEQAISSAAVVPQSDLYALGIILYEMFTHQLPFEAEKPLDVAMLHMTEPPLPPRQLRPDLDPDLEEVILKALAKEPQDRYPDGTALSGALDKALKIAPTKTSAPPPTDPRLSIPQRVAVSLAKRPLPPLPVAISEAEPALVQSQPVPPPAAKSEKVAARAEPTPSPAKPASSTAPSQRSLIFLGIGIGLVMLFGLILIAVLGWFFWLRGSGSSVAAQTPPAEVAPAVIEGSPTGATSGESNPTPTAPEAAPAALAETPAATPQAASAEPQLIADSVQNFSATPGVWEYLWSRVGENQFQPMSFEQRKYGQCWYAEDYIRICQDSGHPGNGADVAWRWTSQIEGHVRVVLSAHKIDKGGDGVTLLAYHNGQSIQGQKIEPRDTEGILQKDWFEADIKPGDTLLFVMNKDGNTQNDHTFFQVQIYQQ